MGKDIYYSVAFLNAVKLKDKEGAAERDPEQWLVFCALQLAYSNADNDAVVMQQVHNLSCDYMLLT